jgi:hypothetical protein
VPVVPSSYSSLAISIAGVTCRLATFSPGQEMLLLVQQDPVSGYAA